MECVESTAQKLIKTDMASASNPDKVHNHQILNINIELETVSEELEINEQVECMTKNYGGKLNLFNMFIGFHNVFLYV